MNSGNIAVVGKGFSVTRSSGELQVLIPKDLNQILSPLEKQLAFNEFWPNVFSEFYSVPPSITLRKRCLIVSTTELAVVCLSSTEDNHARPSAVAVIVTAPINWQEDDIARITSSCHRIAIRTARHLGEIFRSDQKVVQTQLQNGNLFLTRTFNLLEENSQTDSEWETIVSQIRKWDGITGIGDSELLLLGLNVLIGTEGEAQRIVSSGVNLDGYFDPRTKNIMALGQKLRLFPPIPAPKEPTDILTGHIQNVEKSLNSINADLQVQRSEIQSLRGFVEDNIDRLFKYIKKALK